MGVEETDEELVRKALQGARPEAEAAFAVLVDRWKAPLFGFVRSRVRQAEEAEGLAFDAFFEAWKSLPSLQGPFRPWLFGIAWNLVRGHVGDRAMNLAPTPVEQALLDAQPVLDDPSVRLDLAEVLALLPPESLRQIRDKFLLGLTYREMEEKYGIPASTLREHICETCDRLEGILQKRGLLEHFTRGIAPRAGKGPISPPPDPGAAPPGAGPPPPPADGPRG